MTRIILRALVLLALMPAGAEADPVGTPRTAQTCNVAAARRATPAGVIGLSHEVLGAAERNAAARSADSAVGQPMQVRVIVSSPFPVASLTVEVYTHDGLVVSPQRLEVAELKAHEPLEWIVTATPYVAGDLRFSVLARGRVDGRAQAGQLSVPVRVGEARRESVPMGQLTANESGEPIVVLESRPR